MVIKAANRAEFDVTSNIISRIRNEDPSFWPHGVSPHHFDGGLYLVTKQATSEAVGFVGWQEREEGMKKVGYYSIGILPEHRRKDYARSAVRQLLAEKAAGVDEVRAMIMSHNTPSKRLAQALGVRVVEKSAMSKGLAAQLAGTLAGGTGTAYALDRLAHPGSPRKESLTPWKWDENRQLIGGLNVLLGGAGAHSLATGDIKNGLMLLGAAPAKDLALKGVGTLDSVDHAARAATNSLNQPKPPGLPNISRGMLTGAAGVGALGLLLAGILNYRRTAAMEQQTAAQRAGRIRVTLPTKEPGDIETSMELPIDDANISDPLRHRLGRDIRRKLQKETRDRTRFRRPRDPAHMTAGEKVDMQLQQEIENENLLKAAAPAAPQVTSPPLPGVNPAMRMSQEQQAVQAAGAPSTDANPQIMQAQQEAAQAQQEAQAASAQAEQEAGQQAMSMQQQHQVETMKLQQQNETLKLKLEKEKAERELTDKSKELSSGGEDTAIRRVNTQRLDRIRRLVQKSAAASVAPPQFLAPTAMADLNARGNSYVASGKLSPIGVYRTSYGAPLDALFEKLVRPAILQPKPAGAEDLYGNLRDRAADALLRPRL